MDTQEKQMNHNISFLRIRPCDNDNEIYLNSRKKEGTSGFLLKEELNLNLNQIHKKGFQTLSKNLEDDSDVWLIKDDNWKNFKEINPKRLIYLFKNNKESALEVIDRLSPHTILISKTTDLDFIKSINTSGFLKLRST